MGMNDQPGDIYSVNPSLGPGPAPRVGLPTSPASSPTALRPRCSGFFTQAVFCFVSAPLGCADAEPFTEVQLAYNIMSVSGAQHGDPTLIYIMNRPAQKVQEPSVTARSYCRVTDCTP